MATSKDKIAKDMTKQHKAPKGKKGGPASKDMMQYGRNRARTMNQEGKL